MRKAARSIGATAVLLVAIGVAAPVAAAADEPNVEIASAVYEGSGCPKRGDARASLDGDRIKVNYERLSVRAGGSGEPSSERHNCVTNLKLRVDEGWQYAIGRLSMSGYATLKRGATGTAIATHWHAGLPSTGEARNDLSGPYDDEFDSYDRQHGNWSECDANRALNINAQVFVEAKGTGGSSELQLNERRGLTAELKFRRC
ncbi:hypothetical protein GCM10010123_18870 [Pilimelia anulata]|uniref:DUF4360 domain-containing protein n=1 Tax=Pilimelia anulata TaxID=53371 RepID=A0A8J3B9F3_9ACTN|nr:hypothetical protein GCM10010123_18870 [Pilimelia anulata]